MNNTGKKLVEDDNMSLQDEDIPDETDDTGIMESETKTLPGSMIASNTVDDHANQKNKIFTQPTMMKAKKNYD